MEKLNICNQKIPKKVKPNKKKPIKIIYFSNPKKVLASPAEFRAVVQELTGWNSDVADLSNFPSIDNPPAPPEPTSVDAAGNLPPSDRSADRYAAAPFEMLNEAAAGCFSPTQMLESFQGFPPSAPHYDPLGEAFRDLDAI